MASGNNKRPIQVDKIINYLRNHHGITQYEATRDLGILRLSARIYELKEQGYEILDYREDVLNRDGVMTHPKRYVLKEN